MQINGIVLAAGQGKRMKSKLYKVLHPVCGRPMVGHVVDLLHTIQARRTIVVVGHGAETVKSYLGNKVEYALQEEQLGTGHAVIQTKDLLQNEDGLTIVVCGDTPLVTTETLQEMIRVHVEQGAAATILTAVLDDAHGYGRIIRQADEKVNRIVEQKDCSPEEDKVREINTGTYCFNNKKLFSALSKVTNDNVQQEYYLTDVISILKDQGEVVEGYCTKDASESIGVNDRIALSHAEKIMQERIHHKHMKQGVTIINAEQTYIEADVQIGMDSTVYPGTVLRGSTVIGNDCIIGPNTEIINSQIADEVEIKHSVLLEAVVENQASIGPFAYLRPGAVIGERVKIGDFVEIKNASLGEGSKVSHLSYVGDASIGKNVNFGCGAITVNYDGYKKHKTNIEDNAFIGSNVNLVAPITIGKGAFVVAGSTLTHSVPENDLAIARDRQTNKPGYAEKLRRRMKAREE